MGRLIKFIRNNKLYSRDELKAYSKKIDADLADLCTQQILIKKYHGIYSRADSKITDEQLIKKILSQPSTPDHLIVGTDNCPQEYWDLLELNPKTYLILNHKRSDIIRAGDLTLHFKIPFNGFPKKFSREFINIFMMNTNLKKDIFLKFISTSRPPELQSLLKMSLKYGNKSTQKFLQENISKKMMITEVSVGLASLGAPLILPHEIAIELKPKDATELFAKACKIAMSEPRIHNILPFTLLKNIKKINIKKFSQLTKQNGTYRYAGLLLDIINAISGEDGPAFKAPRYNRAPIIIFKNTYGPRGITRLQGHHYEMAEKKWGILIDTNLESEEEKIRKCS